MSADNITLKVEKRTPGKGQSRSLRTEKMIPAVLYGAKVEKNYNLCIDELSVERFSGQGHENSIFSLESDEKEVNGLSVLMKEVTVHPVTRRPEHVDFYALDMSASVKVSVEINLVGKPKGVADEGGVLQVVRRTLEVECMPNKIPDNIEVDISNMALNDTLHISDMKLPDGVVAVDAGELTIANVTTAQAEEPETTEAAEGEAALAAEAAPTEKSE